MNTDLSLICHHCQSNIKDIKVLYSDYVFCCHGCESVFKLLNDHNLCQYYELDENPGIQVNQSSNKSKFVYLDDKAIQSKLINYTDGKIAQIVFEVPQMHCNSCLWLLERLYKLDSNVLKSEVHFERKEVFVEFKIENLSLRSLVELLSNIGYEPYIQLEGKDEESVSRSRSELFRLGLTGFCFANIMMLSLPEYFSKGLIYEASLKQVLPYISLALAIPVFFYSSLAFFIPSYKSLKKGVLTIDFPISLAIIITFIRSLYDISMGLGHGYLDSMSGIVFFMLIGRWLQNRTYTSLQFDRNYKSYFPIAIERIRDHQIETVPIENIQEEDIIKVYDREIIPVDAILSRGNALIDYSFVNGESEPVKIGIGEHIYAGGRQIHGSIELVTTKRHNQSHFTSLWNHKAFQDNKSISKESRIDRWGIQFTWIVLAMSVIASAYWFAIGEYTTMWNAMTTVLIVACPCALLLVQNFTNGHFMRILSKYKFYVRDASILSKFESIDHIVFDKTGTLTETHKHNIKYEGDTLSNEEEREVADIISNSSHKLAQSIYHYLNHNIKNTVSNSKETIGKGLEGWIDNKYYKIGSDAFCGIKETVYTRVNILIDNIYKGSFYFRNVYRQGISKLIQNLKSKYIISVISGDNSSELDTLSKVLPIDSEIRFNQSPADKLSFIEDLKSKNQKVMMVGDGLNDAGAFQVSDIAISLTEKNNYFNPSSDVIMDSENLPQLEKLIKFINSSQKIINGLFIYSILYNIIGLYFALQGKLAPVIAAIIMPISSISIILFIQIITEYSHREHLKDKLWKY